eukprot:GHVR01125459.1.p1 GENE.GHVR01125459.1~~GHVR01125459.1.p1  ORF type:complete len:331 (-),score=104.59 GHVR01125459.1:1-993(-)
MLFFPMDLMSGGQLLWWNPSLSSYSCRPLNNSTNKISERNVAGGKGGEVLLFTEDAVRMVLLKIGSALEYLHEKEHIVHKDVKPENILLAAPLPDGSPLVCPVILPPLSLDTRINADRGTPPVRPFETEDCNIEARELNFYQSREGGNPNPSPIACASNSHNSDSSRSFPDEPFFGPNDEGGICPSRVLVSGGADMSGHDPRDSEMFVCNGLESTDGFSNTEAIEEDDGLPFFLFTNTHTHTDVQVDTHTHTQIEYEKESVVPISSDDTFDVRLSDFTVSAECDGSLRIWGAEGTQLFTPPECFQSNVCDDDQFTVETHTHTHTHTHAYM